MENRDQSGKFMSGANAGPGRPVGKTVEVRLKEVLPVVIDNLIAAAEVGDIDASAALLNHQITNGKNRS